jgi:amidohydrolase
MFGQHVFPEANVGTIQMCEGFVMDSADELYWTIRGSGCHAAQPHLGKDPIYVASAIITHLQTLLTKTKNPLSPGQVTVTSIHGGSATNIVPETVEMKGTLRSFDAEWRELTINHIEQHSRMIAEMHGCTAEVTVLRGYPAVINNVETTSFAWSLAQRTIGSDNVHVFEPKMWGEDFCFYAQLIPCTFWLLGVRPPTVEIMPGLHHPRFAPDENAFAIGTAMLAGAAIDYLKERAYIA